MPVDGCGEDDDDDDSAVVAIADGGGGGVFVVRDLLLLPLAASAVFRISLFLVLVPTATSADQSRAVAAIPVVVDNSEEAGHFLAQTLDSLVLAKKGEPAFFARKFFRISNSSRHHASPPSSLRRWGE